MTWANWIPAVVSTGALAAVGWLLRVPLKKWIESAIGAAFDEKLEKVKSDFRQEEEKLSAELRARAAEIEALRSGAFVNFAARQAELGRRRLLAVERVWAEVTDLNKYRYLSTFAESLNVDAIIESTSKNIGDRRKMSDFATLILGNLADPKAQPPEPSANKERPFIPELTFALFISYRLIVVWPYLLLQSMRLEGDLRLLKTESVVDVARKALPHHGAFLDEHGISGVPFLVEELETAVLASLREALDQKDADEAALAQAKAINEAVSASTAKPPTVDPPKLEG
jgi:hypothetical protein